VTRAVLAAAFAGGAGVLGAWEALGAADAAGLPGRLAGALVPLRRAGREGREPSALERRRLGLVAAGVLLAAGWLLAGPLLGLGLAALGPALALQAVRMRRARWRAALAEDAPLVARALADAVGAGHSVRGALSEAARGLPGLVGAELRGAARELELGARTEDVLERLRVRAGGQEWDTLAAAILLQREAGGDLAGLLRGLAEAQEEAVRLTRDARAATAQARFTGLLVCGLPLGGAALAQLASPGVLGKVLSEPLPATLTVLAVGLQVGSLLAIRRLGKVGE
jgi:tight adherence protein B